MPKPRFSGSVNFGSSINGNFNARERGTAKSDGRGSPTCETQFKCRNPTRSSILWVSFKKLASILLRDGKELLSMIGYLSNSWQIVVYCGRHSLCLFSERFTGFREVLRGFAFSTRETERVSSGDQTRTADAPNALNVKTLNLGTIVSCAFPRIDTFALLNSKRDPPSRAKRRKSRKLFLSASFVLVWTRHQESRSVVRLSTLLLCSSRILVTSCLFSSFLISRFKVDSKLTQSGFKIKNKLYYIVIWHRFRSLQRIVSILTPNSLKASKLLGTCFKAAPKQFSKEN